jgi:glucose-1-phosphate cytidylyltransferase
MTVADLDLVVLCGGRGVRLRPATYHLPKALVPVDGRPILDHILDFLTDQGLRRVHLCIGYKGDMIRQHYQRPLKFDLLFSDLGTEASMLARLQGIRDSVSKRFLVAYADTFVDVSVADILAFHERKSPLATILSAPIRNPFGLLDMGEDGLVRRFEEKPVHNYFVGLSLMERDIFENVTPAQVEMPDGHGIVELFQRLIAAGRIVAFQHQGLNITFNTALERRHAEKAIKHYYTVAEDAAAGTSRIGDDT